MPTYHLANIRHNSYGTILLPDHRNGSDTFYPVYTPDSFGPAEERYLASIQEDKLLWNCYSREAKLVKESDLFSDEERLNSKLYKTCYKGYDIYDSLQYTSAFNRTFLGVLTLFRTRNDKPFTEEEMCLVNSIGLHFNAVLHRIIHISTPACLSTESIRTTSDSFCRKYHLTSKESAIFSLLLQYKNNDEIAESLEITVNTLQKHIQNIFRKTDTASKWELLRKFSCSSLSSLSFC